MKTTQPLNILVVDDVPANTTLICRFAASLGHRTAIARDGAEAVAAFQKQRPDMILMDIMMPVMDGISATKEIRRLSGGDWLPIIFLSAKSAEADQLEVLEIGDDFLPKPINLAMLEAKIKVMARIAEMQRKISEDTARLSLYRKESEAEQAFARQLLEQLNRGTKVGLDSVKYWIKPAQQLSGDVISFAITPEGRLHLLLADSTGHGLAAAICTLPAVDAFISMTEKGLSIDGIAREINAKLNQRLPRGRFVAAVFLSVDREQEQVQIWNGGIPFAGFMGGDGRMVQEWPSAQPPLGMLPDALFDASLETWTWPEGGQIVVSSDGIVEAENEAGAFFGEDGLRAALLASGGRQSFEAVIAAAQKHLGSLDNRDDLSLAAIQIGVRSPSDFHHE